MNLLAESQGLPDAVRILSLFEHQFSMLWEPENISIIQQRPSTQNLFVESKDKSRKNGSAKDKKPTKEDGDRGGDGDKEDKEDKKEKDKDGSDDEGQSDDRLQSIVVSWDDAEIAKYFYR